MLRIAFWHLAVAAFCSLPAPANAEQAAGYVFADKNGNGQRDPGERGIAGVPVSNGRDVVATGGDGSYRLAVEPETTLFISKPAGYGVPLDNAYGYGVGGCAEIRALGLRNPWRIGFDSWT